MNPFVDSKKRSISLPHGCKDLADVLAHPGGAAKSPVRRIINLVLMEAQQEGATELIIGTSPADSDGVPIRYRIEGRWHEMSPFPSHIRSRVVNELRKMAGLAKATFPIDGVLAIALTRSRLVWRIGIANPDTDCVLTRTDAP